MTPDDFNHLAEHLKRVVTCPECQAQVPLHDMDTHLAQHDVKKVKQGEQTLGSFIRFIIV